MEPTDIVYALEDEFSVEFTDHDLMPLNSVGDLSRLLCEKLGLSCMTATAFYRLRAAIVRRT